jgi:hypothetical protein
LPVVDGLLVIDLPVPITRVVPDDVDKRIIGTYGGIGGKGRIKGKPGFRLPGQPGIGGAPVKDLPGIIAIIILDQVHQRARNRHATPGGNKRSIRQADILPPGVTPVAGALVKHLHISFNIFIP